jgi:hypothetical protein
MIPAHVMHPPFAALSYTHANHHRPGFGGSTPVPLNQRIPTFLEIVPALLQHLNIKHISLASHSSGTIFALNLLAKYPELLIPSNPSVTLCCPWVHQSITGVSFLNAAAILPNGLLNYWNNITGFIINTAAPTIGASSGAISSVTGMFKSKAKSQEENEEKEGRCMNGLGIGSKETSELSRFTMKCAFAEETSGANDEARLCLKSVEGQCGWGAADDYPTLVGDVRKVWEERVEGGTEKLKLVVVFAEDDAMIGVKGKKYFEECWKQEKCGSGIVMNIVQAQGTDHDGVIDTMGSTMRTLFEKVKKGEL